MSRSSNRTLAVALAAGAWLLAVDTASADCQPQDLTVVLNTGWDQSTGTAIPAGGTDDDWEVIFDATGPVSYDANVVTPFSAWLTMPGSQWITADKYGPIGTYRYKTCWCMHDDFANPNLSIAVRADDQADILLNGTLIWSLPGGTFNDATAPGMSFINPALFNDGVNCLEVVVENDFAPATGFNLTGWVTADDGKCCDCHEADITDDAATGVDDVTSGLIISGSDDDEWVVTTSASGGVLPRPAEAIDTHPTWDVIPGTKWISADESGPSGLYTYEKCWCMNPLFQNAQVSMQLLADNEADVFLNGNPIGSTPANAFVFPATSIASADQSLFRAGKNCVTIEVTNTGQGLTGVNVDLTVTATNAECCPCADLPADAEGWWPLDETVGPTAFELLNNHDGTWLELPPPTGPAPHVLIGEYVNNSLTLDGINDYVEVPDDPGLDFGATQDFTLDAWIKTGSPLRQAIIHKKKPGLPAELGYRFMTGGVLTMEIADGANFQICNGTTNVADDFWHFVAATVDRNLPGGVTRIRLYVDDSEEPVVCQSAAVSGGLDNVEKLYFGAGPVNPVSGRLWWKGRLDEIEIFRRALSTTEVGVIKDALNTGKCPPERCEDSTGSPMCAGLCPTGSTCVTGIPPASCHCAQPGATCGGSAPQCNGLCPNPNDVCVSNGPDCFCQTPQVACGNSPYPACDGACPVNQVCRPSVGLGCACMVCGTGVPYDPSRPINITMAPGNEILWTPVNCALVYNVYQGVGPALIDQNNDGLADDYGSCHIGDITDTKVKDPDRPQPGAIHWYLVTAENFAGEGPLGNNSSGQPRQATNVCP